MYNGILKGYKFDRQVNQENIQNYSRRDYKTNSQIKFKTVMLRSSLLDSGDAYLLAKETITVA